MTSQRDYNQARKCKEDGTMTKLSTAGQVFKDILELVIANHGIGSSKMVKRYDLYEDSSLDFNNREVANAYFYLIENEYIREYTPTVMRTSHLAHEYGKLRATATKNGTYVGLTGKGWSVAHKYLNA